MKSLIKIFLYISAIIVVCLIYVIHTSFYKEYDLIKERLEEFDNVKVLKMDGENESGTLDHIYAIIEIDKKVKLRMVNLKPEDFYHAEELYFTEVDGWHFSDISCDGNWSSSSFLELGEYSILEQKYRIEYKNVRDVIEHYEKLQAVVDSIKTFPDVTYFSTFQGEVYITKYKSESSFDYDLFHDKVKFKSDHCTRHNR